MSKHMDFNNGEYTVIHDDSGFRALRYGGPWRNLNGDHLVYFMLVEAIRLKEERDALAEWKRQAEWIDEPFKAEALAEHGFAAPTPREFAKKILERHRPHVAKLQAERDVLAAKLKELEEQEPVAWMPAAAITKLRSGEPKIVLSGVPCYKYEGMGTSPIFARPVPAEPVNARLAEMANQCRLDLVVQLQELADHIERIQYCIRDEDARKQIVGQMRYAIVVSSKWNQNGNPFIAAAESQQVDPVRLTIEQERNAERYAYLRSQHEGSVAASFAVFAPEQPIGEFGPVGSMPGELDAAIDSAMRADSHKVEG